MASSDWYSLQPSRLLPPGVTQITSTFTTLSETLASALEVSKTALELARTFAESASTNPLESALEKVIKELQEYLKALTGETTAHGIFIPIQKQPFGLGIEPPINRVPTEDRILNYAGIAEGNGIDVDAEHPEFLINFIDSAAVAVGGNRGFWKRLRLSMKDAGDESKPEFPENFAVAGTVVLFGAHSIKDITKQAKIFKSLVKHNPRDDLTSKTAPVLKNVRARKVPDPASGRIGVVLQWDPLPTVQNPGLFSEEQLIADEILVIRSTDPEFREKMTWDEVFPSQPSADLSELPEEGATQVVVRIVNEGFVRKYVDLLELEEGTTYYYALACRYTLDGERQPVGPLSGVVRVNFNKKPSDSRQGTAPDWFATPSLVEMFPVLKDLLGRIDIAIEQMTSRTSSGGGATGAIDQSIKQLNEQIEKIEKLNSQLQSTNKKLSTFLGEDPGGIYTTVIAVDHGGMDTWMAELARALSDPSDPNRPPFDDTELVAGIVILAGAPAPPELEAFKTLLELFFGSTEDNPILEAVSTVERAVATVEARSFDETLRSVASSDIEEPDIAPSVVFDDAMVPSPTTSCE